MNGYSEKMNGLPPRFRQVSSYDAAGFYESYGGQRTRRYRDMNSRIQRPNIVSRVLYYVFRALWGFNVVLSEVLMRFLGVMGLHEVWAAAQPFLFLFVILNILNCCPIWLLFMGATVAVFYALLVRRMKKRNPYSQFF